MRWSMDDRDLTLSTYEVDALFSSSAGRATVRTPSASSTNLVKTCMIENNAVGLTLKGLFEE